MTLSRAFDELARAGIASIEQHGRKKFLSFNDHVRSLIKRSKTFLIRPNRRITHIRLLKTKVALPLAVNTSLRVLVT